MMVAHGMKAAIALVAALSLLARANAADSGGDLSTITIEALRQDTEKRVHAFVSHAPVLVNSESFARWNTPICPLVAGLPRASGEFVLTRISQIVISVGAPLAPHDCSANLVIIVASDPVALLKAWAARVHYVNLFGSAGMFPIKRFLNSPRPVRVWYNHESAGADGAVVTPDSSLSGAAPSASAKMSGSYEAMRGVRTNSVHEATRLEWSEVWGISSVIELVSSARMKGFNLGQMADYIAMAGLAEFNLDADYGTAPTILRLFNAPAVTGTSSLGTWDEAFLKALYHTRQSSTLQTGLITQSMVRDIKH
jgi:hypothetical protein